MENVTFKWIKDVFAKGLIDDIWEHNFPVSFSPFERNIRIRNKSLVVRDGILKVFDWSSVNRVYELISNENLYAIYNRHLYSIDLDAWTATQQSTSQMNDARLRAITYGKYIIILTGDWYPYVYDVQADSFSQLTSSNIENWANAWFWEVYANFTFVAGSWNNASNLYISRGITKASPQYSHDRVWSGSETINVKSPIKWLRATLQRLFVFTEKTIGFMDESTITNIGSVSVSFMKDISKDNVPVSPEAVVAAQDRILMLTADKNVKEVWRAWVNDIEVANISERAEWSIRRYLARLSDDLSDTYGVFNQEENLVMWYVKRDGASIPNHVLIYDLTNDTFHIDTGKIFGSATYHNNKLYAWWFTSALIYEENSWNDDDWQVIPRERRTVPFYPAEEHILNMFKQIWLAGEHNALSTINIDVYVEGEQVAWPFTIVGDSFLSWGTGSLPTGSYPTWWDKFEVDTEAFSKIAEFRSQWKKIQLRLYWDKYGGKTAITKLGIWFIPLTEIHRDEHLFETESTRIEYCVLKDAEWNVLLDTEGNPLVWVC